MGTIISFSIAELPGSAYRRSVAIVVTRRPAPVTNRFVRLCGGLGKSRAFLELRRGGLLDRLLLISALLMGHLVHCRNCDATFDLFAAAWCPHGERPSKLCPRCHRCFCGLASYRDPGLWKDAPAAFRRMGFQKIFVDYL